MKLNQNCHRKSTAARWWRPLVLLIICGCAPLQLAFGWRALNALVDGGPVRHFTDYFQPPPSPFMQNIYTNSQAVNLSPFAAAATATGSQQQSANTQILTPSSSSYPTYQVEPVAASVASHTPLETQQEFSGHPHERQQQQLQPVATSSNQAELREEPNAMQQDQALASTRAPQQQQQQSTSAPSPPPSSSSRVSEHTQPEPEDDQKRRREPINSQPSPFGKILESVYQAGANATLTGVEQAPKTRQPEGGDRPASLSAQHHNRQILTPRRSSDAARAKPPTPAAIEQQIIDQHARAAAGYNLHSSQYATTATVASSTTPALQQQQRLSPASKNRGSESGVGNKSLGSLLFNSLGVLAGSSSADASGEHQQQSPISTLMSNFKSGISSRSSIMKAAISDNKLARTLTSVSKTLGGNKYVASAGIAAALAALGLTVGKYLSPYSLSAGQQYSKLGEPMIASGSSYLTPSLAAYLGGNERNLALPGYPAATSYMDSLATAASNYETPGFAPYGGQAPNFEPMQLQQQQPSQQFPTMVNYDQASLNQLAAAAGLYPSNQHTFAAPQPQSSANYISLRPASSRLKMPLDSANGHYSSFYSNQPESVDADQSEPMQQMNGASQSASSQQYGSYISGAPSMAATGQQQQQQQPLAYQQTGRLESVPGNNQPSELQMQTFDHAAAASLEAPSYQRAPQFSERQRVGGQAPRRSGAVSLKLDKSARNRLEQQLASNQLAPEALRPAASYNYFVLNSPGSQLRSQTSQASPAANQLARGDAQQASRATRHHQPEKQQQLTTMMTNGQWSATASAAKSTRSQLNRANEEGQLVSSDSITSSPLPSPSAGQNEGATKQQDYRLIRPASSAERVVFNLASADQDAKRPPVGQTMRPQTIVGGAGDRGWKSIDVSSNEVGATRLSPLSSNEYTHMNHVDADHQLHRVSRTPAVVNRGVSQQSEEDRLAREQLQQLAELINQQRAFDQQRQQERQQLLDRAPANEVQSAPQEMTNSFVVANDSIWNKSVELGGDKSADGQATQALKTIPPAAQHTNDDKTPKSIGTTRSETSPASRQVGDNKQSATQQQQQQQAGDNVVVELIDSAEFLGDAPTKQTVATSGELNKATIGRRHQQDDEQPTDDEQDGEQGGKLRAYRGLVAGSINGAN